MGNASGHVVTNVDRLTVIVEPTNQRYDALA
jgi:hypothetical protein